MNQMVLAVDDQIHMLKLLERIIEEYTDYGIVSTSNPLEAKRFLEVNQYDLIITDLKMPGFDGLQLLKLIKEGHRFEEVIIITAFASLESAMQALSFGVFDYLTKPFKKERILESIERAMKLQREKRLCRQMEDLFKTAPYSKAETQFREQYIRLLSERCSGEAAVICREAGLSSEEIERILSGETHTTGET